MLNVTMRLIRKVYHYLQIKKIPVEKCLLGNKSGVDAGIYAKMIKDLLLPSTSIVQSPHVGFLRQFSEEGENIFQKEIFEATAYYKLAFITQDIFGNWFEAKRPEEIIEVARRFVGMDNNKSETEKYYGGSERGAKIVVRPIKFSD